MIDMLTTFDDNRPTYYGLLCGEQTRFNKRNDVRRVGAGSEPPRLPGRGAELGRRAENAGGRTFLSRDAVHTKNPQDPVRLLGARSRADRC